MKKISVKEVEAEMQRIYKLNDNTAPKMKFWKAESSMSVDVVQNHSGTWKKSWTALGLLSEKESMSKKREAIIHDLQRAFYKANDTIGMSDLIRASNHTRETINKYFDSPSHALEIARIDLNKRIPSALFIQDFMLIYDTIGDVPTDKDIKEMGTYQLSSFLRRFGSIDNLAEIAGVSRTPGVESISEDTLLDELTRVQRELGRVPTHADITKHSDYSADAYQRMFGNFSAALGKLGLNPAKKTSVSVKCPECGDSHRTIISHMKSLHPEALLEHEEHVLELYLGGLSNKAIAARDDVVLYNGASSINRVVKQYLSAEKMEELRKSKIKNTMVEDYASGKYDWVKKINTDRNVSPEAKKRNSEGLKKAYASGKRSAWNKGLTKENDARVAAGAEATKKTLKDGFSSGEIERKIGPESSQWKPDRDDIVRRLGQGFNKEARASIKARANNCCENCSTSQDELVSLGQYLECDHVRPIYQGGSGDWETNGQALCPSCHQSKTRKDEVDNDDL